MKLVEPILESQGCTGYLSPAHHWAAIAFSLVGQGTRGPDFLLGLGGRLLNVPFLIRFLLILRRFHVLGTSRQRFHMHLFFRRAQKQRRFHTQDSFRTKLLMEPVSSGRIHSGTLRLVSPHHTLQALDIDPVRSMFDHNRSC